MQPSRAFAEAFEPSSGPVSIAVEAERDRRSEIDEINSIIGEIPLEVSLAALTAARAEYRRKRATESEAGEAFVQAQSDRPFGCLDPAVQADDAAALSSSFPAATWGREQHDEDDPSCSTTPPTTNKSTLASSSSSSSSNSPAGSAIIELLPTPSSSFPPSKVSSSALVARNYATSRKAATTSSALVNLPTSSETFFRLDLVFLLFSVVLRHELAVLTSTASSNGGDLRYLPFSQLTDEDVAIVGRGFYACAFANSGPYAAVEEFIRTFYFLKELDENCSFFRKAMDSIALVIFLQRSSFGANFRLYFGAGLSIVDMVTDLIMIATYIRDSNWGFANSMIAMLSLCMAFQLNLAFLQNRKRGLRAVLLEMLASILCISPGLHAYRVASGHEKHGNETVNPRTLLIYCKCNELVFEAVPGLILQLFAYLTLERSSRFAFFSIATSAVTTAFSVSVMYFDKDMDPECRRFNPYFYGVFPDDIVSRSIAFFWLFMFSIAHVISKGFGVALFWATFGGYAVFLYYGAEVLVFFAIKALRSDLVFWAPVEGLVVNVLMSVIARVVDKVLTDFTGFLQMRHAYDSGGLFWTLSLLWSQISSVICVVLYQFYYEDEREGEERRASKIDATAMYIVVASLVLFWLVSVSSFIRKINQKYLHTFFGTMTGSQYTIHLFKTGTTDRMKMEAVFSVNHLHWVSIKEEVMAYSHANWASWKQQKPDWFTEHFIAMIPNEFIPRADPSRKRKSFLHDMLGLTKGERTYPTSNSKNTSKVAAE